MKYTVLAMLLDFDFVYMLDPDKVADNQNR